MTSLGKSILAVAVVGILTAWGHAQAPPLLNPPKITYQGELRQLGQNVNGLMSFDFSLWDTDGGACPAGPIGGTQIGSTNARNNFIISHGSFFFNDLDFGGAAFNGERRFLQITIRPPQSAAVTLCPRVEITPAPYALALPAVRNDPTNGDTIIDRGFRMPTGAVAGHVLKCNDASGNASWQPGGGGGPTGGGWVHDVTVVRLETATDSVGIGNASPAHKLDVTGNIHASGTVISGSSITIDGTAGSEKISSTGSLDLRVAAERALRLENNATSPNVVGGHGSNSVTGARGAAIGGGGDSGEPNSVTANYGTVGGGSGNSAEFQWATVSGGHVNEATGDSSTVGGGGDNHATGFVSTVSGGLSNTASGSNSTIGGGKLNIASGDFATVGAGAYNQARAFFATIAGGGPTNLLFAPLATNNQVYDDFGTIGGGGNNKAGIDDANPGNQVGATVAGGTANVASGTFATVGGGANNYAAGYGATIAGGAITDQSIPLQTRNAVYDNFGTIGGGGNNEVGIDDGNTATQHFATIAGGEANLASASWSTVAGGRDNQAGGQYSFAAGRGARVRNATESGTGAGDQGTFIWADSTPASFTSTAPDQFLIRAFGGVGINRGNVAPLVNALEVEGNASKTAAGDWLANSDARIKRDVQTVSHALETLDKVRLVEFRYTDDYRAAHPTIQDGPYLNIIAQEFGEIFPDHVKSGSDTLPDGSKILQADTYPLTIYSAAAVQELHRMVQEKDCRIGELEQKLASLEALVTKLAAQPNGGGK